ncbi:YczE/YyaS/YitT family protein [Saccharopolyspora sp. CA-218241]|uniref:membrane protein YczE n=1 Tax=Saccharopolyspora sp. CA-218241 TaxID=3240027 RepID=UPI003D98DDE1
MVSVATTTPGLDLSALPIRSRPALRFTQLFGGLVLYGASMGLLVRAQLGLMPWDVLHEGLAERLGWTFGSVTVLTGVLVLLAWLPLRQRPGLGTVANILVIGVSVDATLALVPPLDPLAAQVPVMLGAVVLNAAATAVYVGARFGPGPRDGLMTGLHARTGYSVRAVRTTLEVAVVATGALLGGTIGVATVIFALGIGPLTQLFLRFAVVREKKDLCP